jgi:hypothetical protein
MMERWNELVLVPAAALMIEVRIDAWGSHRFDGEVVDREIPAKSSNKLQTRDCHCLLACYPTTAFTLPTH